MALTKELLKVLDNEDEPLPKRLKIADNVFKSIALPVQRREATLLKWLGKSATGNAGETCNLLFGWLTSPQMQDLNRNDITQEDVKNLMNLLVELIEEPEAIDMTVLVGCLTAFIENHNFQLFFKYDVAGYCCFVSKVLDGLDTEEHVHSFISNSQLFTRNLISDDQFREHFMTSCFVGLKNAGTKFSGSKPMCQEISKLLERCLFHRNFKSFSQFLKVLFEEEAEETDNPPDQLPIMFFKYLKKFYRGPYTNLHKLVFHSFCTTYNNNFDLIYKCFIVIVGMLGFDVATCYNLSMMKKYKNPSVSWHKSIKTLTGLCQVLSENNIDSSLKIKDLSLPELILKLTTNIISINDQPNEDVYEFLNCVIALDPLLIEKRLEAVLSFIMLSDKTATKTQYESFFVSVFEVFGKLHRIPNLLSKIIRTLKSGLEKRSEDEPTVNGDAPKVSVEVVLKDVMPEGILNCFTRSITVLVSWQVINLFKTLLFHLEEAVTMDLTTEAEPKIIYIDVVSTLMCQFLSSVRIAEHTVSTAVVEKFVNTMNELKEVLGKFGTTLVNMEHNPILMRAYLNTCYTWGELYIVLAYYSINNEVVLQKNLDSDSSACNITYLHPYLIRDQWCLISQRIANFGEKPCKQIMHKLYIQKLKAMMLFEGAVNEDIASAVRTSVLSSIDDYWKDVVFDQLVQDEIIAKASSLEHLAKIILPKIIEIKAFKELDSFYDCKELLGSMLYTCLHKINRVFKKTHKKLSLSCKIFPSISEEMFLNPNQNLEALIEVFVQQLQEEAKNPDREVFPTLDEKDVSDYMDVIKAVPVAQYDAANIQHILIMQLICVLLDLQRCNLSDSGLISKCEGIIIGLAQSYNGSFNFLIKPFQTMQIVIDRFPRHLDVFSLVVKNIFKRENLLKGDNGLEDFKGTVKFLTKNIDEEKYLRCAVIVLNNIGHKYKKYTISNQSKNLLMEYEEDICTSISKAIKSQKVPDLKFTEAFTISLNYYLSKKSAKEVSELVPFLSSWIEAIISNPDQSKGVTVFFTTILRNKSSLKTPEDIFLKVWEYCQNLNVEDKEQEQYSQLVVLIFEQIPAEQFAKIAYDLLKTSMQALAGNDVTRFIEQLKIWNTVVMRSLNPKKLKMLQDVLKNLLLEGIVVHLKDETQIKYKNIHEDVVKFETNMIVNLHLLLSPPLIDSILVTVSILNSISSENFASNFTLCVSLMEALVKFRKPLLMDCLSSYLQRYRALLNQLCIKSNSDLKLEPQQIQEVSNCAHKLEKLTRTLVHNCNRDLVRISPYLIADVLKHYEKITLLPNVKIHLNNCLYSLISLCDEHAISYLIRILSTASTEMFKVTYTNYKKYYKFTGRV